MSRTPPTHPRKQPPPRSIKRHVAAIVRDLTPGREYVVTADLADFYYHTLNGSKANGRVVIRELKFTPAFDTVLQAKRTWLGISRAWIGVGYIDGGMVPGVCWLAVSDDDAVVRLGIGYRPDDWHEPVGEPGTLANRWLGATSDKVLSVQECKS